MMHTPSWFLILLLSLAPALAWAAPAGAAEEEVAGPRNLTVDDYFRFGDVSDPQISPEGDWIAYTVTTADLEEDESLDRVWMIPASGGEAVPMTSEESPATRPRWSPDGKYLAFLAERNGEKKQVWTLFRHGGDSVQLTETIQGVKSYDWSPDGRKLILVLQDPKPEDLEKEDEEGENCQEEDETPKPWVIDRLQFKQDYVGYLDRRRTHLYVLDVETKEMTQITSGDYDDSEPAWSPDGRFLAFVSNRTEDPDRNYNDDIWIVAADNPDKGKTLRRVTSNPGPDNSPAWSPDGEFITCVSATDTEAIVYATPHLAIVPAGGGKAKILTQKVDRHVSDPRFALDGKSIYFILEDGGESILARVPAGGGPEERLVSGKDVVEEFMIGNDGAIAALISRPHLPPEVFSITSGRLEQISRTNEEILSEIRLGDVEKIRFKSKDGTEIEGFVVKPPAFQKGLRYPAFLRIHGGPVSQYDFGFHYEAQLFAANGYVVILPNPRGSSGYGQEFSLSIWQDWGDKDYEDVMAAVDHLIGLGYADPERLGVGGWSYGGMLTNHVIVRSDRFKAAVTGASASLYVANYGHDQYQRWWEYELGLPWEKKSRDMWERISPFNKVEMIVTPTLVVGGEKDWNVPIVNSEHLYEALKRLGRTTQLVVYPGEYHGIETPSYIKDLYERWLGWYEEHVKTDTDRTRSGGPGAGKTGP